MATLIKMNAKTDVVKTFHVDTREVETEREQQGRYEGELCTTLYIDRARENAQVTWALVLTEREVLELVKSLAQQLSVYMYKRDDEEIKELLRTLQR